MTITIKLTEAELAFLTDTLDEARAEFETLISSEDWYATELDEKCLAAFNILKYAEKGE